VPSPTDSFATAEAFAQLAEDLYRASDVEQAAAAVLRAGSQVVNCCHTSLLLTDRRGRLRAGPATDPIVDTVNCLQIERQLGPAPCVLACRDVVLVPDTVSEDRWPEWVAAAAELGLRSVLALPLATNGGMLGVLELFSIRPYAFQPDEVVKVRTLSGHLAVALQHARQEATLREAMESHKLTGQATGMLMERYRLDADQAFAVLRRCSQDKNLKLQEVAEQLIQTGRLPKGARLPQRV
jgi:GAF domain-containing protein